MGARSEGEDKCNSSDMCQTTVQKRTCDCSQYHHTYTPSYQVMFSGDGWSGRLSRTSLSDFAAVQGDDLMNVDMNIGFDSHEQ